MGASLRGLGMAASGLIGGLLILIGTVNMLAGMSSGEPGLAAWGVFWLTSGLVLLPPTSAALRRRFSSLRAPIRTPLIAVVLLIAGPVLGSFLGVRGGVSTETASHSESDASGARAPADEQGQGEAEDPLTVVRRLVDEGTPESTTEAMVLMDREFGQRRINADPNLTELYAEATEAADRAMIADRAQAYVDQAQGPWLEAVQGISGEAPTEPEEIWRRVRAFEEGARQIEEGGEFSGHAEATAARTTLRDALTARQRAVFPALRAAYGAILDRLMWERDVDVIVQGNGSRTIRFVAAMFAANRNIASSQRAAGPNLDKLRFSRSQYEWYAGSQATYYTLETPSDDEVGYWEGGAFVTVQ